MLDEGYGTWVSAWPRAHQMFTAGLSVDDAATTVYLLKISTNLIHIGTVVEATIWDINQMLNPTLNVSIQFKTCKFTCVRI